LHTVGDTQCFPLSLFEQQEKNSDELDADLFTSVDANEHGRSSMVIKDGITDEGLKHFTDAYNGVSISKEDLFYYIYGLLHSEEYKVRYADNLSKELPRIPAVKKFDDFMAFSAAGRKLADLHLNYETVEPYAVNFEGGALLLNTLTDSDYYVTQMKFASKGDKTTVIYNHKITMHDIPVEAYEYVVNGKSALEWVMERQAVTKHKDSGIVNDANLWAKETMGDAAYPLKLFQRVITVSLETMKIVKALPKLDID
jgi:predicted helicase